MANNSCRFKWTHCNTLSIHRAECQWHATKRFTQAWQALCIWICQFLDKAVWNISSCRKALEPQAVSRLSQALNTTGPAPCTNNLLIYPTDNFWALWLTSLPHWVGKSYLSWTSHFLETQSIILVQRAECQMVQESWLNSDLLQRSLASPKDVGKILEPLSLIPEYISQATSNFLFSFSLKVSPAQTSTLISKFWASRPTVSLTPLFCCPSPKPGFLTLLLSSVLITIKLCSSMIEGNLKESSH